ncbi:MAG: hypothetical protein ABUR63_07960 [Verrucomicrobiota bacterium]
MFFADGAGVGGFLDTVLAAVSFEDLVDVLVESFVEVLARGAGTADRFA